MEKSYKGEFFVSFGEEEDETLVFKWNSSDGLLSNSEDTSDETVAGIIGNISARTDLGGVIAYSPVGPFLEFNLRDPKVIYLALYLTFPDAFSIRYEGSLENREEWEEFTSEMQAPPVDKDGFPVVR
jgi:hypothetical protein